MRIAFFGGSFDPPHRGHVAIARAAADRLALDRVLVAPVGRQPLKDGWTQSAYADRLAMVELAFAGDPRFEASRLDAPLPDERYNYSYDTLVALKHLLAKVEPTSELFCLLGADSFHTLPHWHRARELVLLCNWIIAARPGHALHQLAQQLPAGLHVTTQTGGPDLLQLQISGPSQQARSNDARSTLYVLPDLEEDVSATALRHALASGNTHASDGMLSPAVAHYIRDHALYQADPA